MIEMIEKALGGLESSELRQAFCPFSGSRVEDSR